MTISVPLYNGYALAYYEPLLMKTNDSMFQQTQKYIKSHVVIKKTHFNNELMTQNFPNVLHKVTIYWQRKI